MIVRTAALYAALGQGADVEIEVHEETSTDAELFVADTASGDCGTVIMHRASTEWIITEQSQECVD